MRPTSAGWTAQLAASAFNRLDQYARVSAPSLPIDSIWALVLVWRIRGKIIRTGLYSCAQWYTHMWTVLTFCMLGLDFCLCVYLGFSVLTCYLRSSCSCIACFCCADFSFFSTSPTDWLWRTSPKWFILYRVGRSTLTISINQSIYQSINPNVPATPVNSTWSWPSLYR